MEFRLANNNDLDLLVDLEKKYFKSPWTKEQYYREINENEFSKNVVLIENNHIVGYINYWIIFDQATINKIFVIEEKRKLGYGQKLLDFAIENIKENNCIIVTLEVRVSNKNAIKLYENNNFKTVVRKKEYYSDKEDAFYMVRGVD